MGWIFLAITCIVFVIALLASDYPGVWGIFIILLSLTGGMFFADSNGLWVSRNQHKNGYPYFFPLREKKDQGRSNIITITTQSQPTQNNRFQNKTSSPKQVSYTPTTTAPPLPTAVKVTCPKCGAPMVVRNGRYGKFYGCTRFPQCRGSKNL